MKSVCLLSSLVILSCCTEIRSQEKALHENFNDYWYGGEAELTSYKLEQARYGEIHAGEAVMVFVTEPFSRSKQVKLDDWKRAGDDRVDVMKLNFTKNFLTGIYPYSMMTSTFTPAEADARTLKITTSSQEWCGHTFMQVNQERSGKYKVQGFSYFESEGDFETTLPDVLLEDQIWTQIRLNPSSLPVGNVKVLPGTFYLRLRHRELAPLEAAASLETINESEYGDETHQKFSLQYADRSLTIYFGGDFPHEILGWEETYQSGFGEPQQLTTRAKRINSMKSAYWGQNSNADRELRQKLGLRTE